MPRLADVTAMRISVLSPVGSALMGLAVGGSIQWPVPGGHYRTMAVVAVSGDAAAG
jgi:regulator of nucleoside diphosphate kinase